jgi:hypothetical protein
MHISNNVLVYLEPESAEQADHDAPINLKVVQLDSNGDSSQLNLSLIKTALARSERAKAIPKIINPSMPKLD